MATSSNTEASSLNLGKPRATIPDMYVGFSPSFSSHFLSSSNIALPFYQDGSSMSPLIPHNTDLFEYYENQCTMNGPPSPFFLTPFYEVKKGRHRLSVEEFNARFSGQPTFHTRLTRNVSKLKKTMRYFGTIGRPLYAPPKASSVPCTPVRSPNSFLNDYLLNKTAVTPMRLQYRLKQMSKKRPILIQSPLRQNHRAILRNESHCSEEDDVLFVAFDESGKIEVPSLPKNESQTENDCKDDVNQNADSESAKKTDTPSIETTENALELVGNVKNVALTGSEEVVLDLNNVTIFMKEVPPEYMQCVIVLGASDS